MEKTDKAKRANAKRKGEKKCKMPEKKAFWEVKYTHTKQNDFLMLFRSEHSSTRGILNFSAKGIKYFGALKTKWKCP